MSENGVTKGYSKNADVKQKYALRCLCGQEHFCRVNGQVVLTTWAAREGEKTVTPFFEFCTVDKA